MDKSHRTLTATGFKQWAINFVIRKADSALSIATFYRLILSTILELQSLR